MSMDEARILGTIIVAIGSLMSILIPIFKISSNITSMKNSIDHMMENDKRRDERINNHGREIDLVVRQVDKNGVTIANMQTQLNRHEDRINSLENKLNKSS